MDKFIKKNEIHINNIHKIKYYFLFIPVFKIKIFEYYKEYYIFGIKIKTKSFLNNTNCLNIINSNNLKVVFDHNCGGGTEVFFFNEILKENKTILRIQPYLSQFKLSIYTNNNIFEIFYDFDSIKNILFNISNSEIYINNLVNYKNIPKIINLISELKNKNNKILMYGHDFFAICPCWNLIDNNDIFCEIPNLNKCQNCFNKNPYINKNYTNSIKSWRNLWNVFFTNTLDKLIVFSENSKDLFLRAYPSLNDKINVIPHQCKTFERQLSENRKTEYPNYINIGIPGNITFIKGKEIVSDMSKLINSDKYSSIKITIIGEYVGDKNINVTGKYKRDDFPEILEKNKIDIVFISSICPETYSYTTTEAISLGIPVACFNIGAPPERVAKYNKGLVISKISAKIALDEMTKFVKSLENSK